MFNRLNSYGLLLVLVSGLAQAAVGVPSGAYTLENTHGYISFSYSHLGFSRPHVGFNTFTVDLDLNSEDPAKSSVKVDIDANSIDSRVAEFDGHLKGDKFFATTANPSINFVSTGIKMNSDTTASITGNLTIKGVTKPVTLEATLNKAAVHPMRKVPTLGLNATAKLKRSDWGLAEYVPMVSDEVDVVISVELIKK